VSDTTLPLPAHHRPPNWTANTIWSNTAQLLYLTPLSGAVIAATQIFSAGWVLDSNFLDSIFRRLGFPWCAKMLAAIAAASTRNGMRLPQELGQTLTDFRPYLNTGADWGCSRGGTFH